MVNLPVFPGAEPPNDQEIETAYSLLAMNPHDNKIDSENTDQLTLQEPIIGLTTPHQAEPSTTVPDLTAMLLPNLQMKLTNTMEHIVGHVLINTPPAPLGVPDVMDAICKKSVLVETQKENDSEYVLVPPNIERKLKPCCIKLTRINLELSYIPKQNLCETLMHAGRPHTRSTCTPKPPPSPPRCGRSRHSKLQDVNYKDPDTTSDEDLVNLSVGTKPKTKPNIKPNATGPTDDRINAQNSKTAYPMQRLLPIKSDTPISSSSDPNVSDTDTEPYVPNTLEKETTAPKGTFRITD